MARISGLLEPAPNAPVSDALHVVFLASVPLGLVALVLAVALPERPLRTWPGRDKAAAEEPAEEPVAA